MPDEAVTRWTVQIHWGWGSGYRFSETWKTGFSTPPTQEEVALFVGTSKAAILKRYEFDCGRESHPLYPEIYDVAITPECETVSVMREEYRIHADNPHEGAGG